MSQPSDKQVFGLEILTDKSHEVAKASKVPKHVKRPMNAFMVWAHERRKKMSTVSPTMHHSNISKILGAEWKLLSDKEKMPFVDKAKKIHEKHMVDNPDYKYRPQRKVRNIQKRPRPIPPPLPIAPASRNYSATIRVVDDTPFEIPIIGVTSVRTYTMEEYNFRLSSLPHLTQKASDFSTHPPPPPMPKIRPVLPAATPTTPSKSTVKPMKQIITTKSPLQVTSRLSSLSTLSTVRPGTFSLKPLASGLKMIPTGALSKVTIAQGTKVVLTGAKAAPMTKPTSVASSSVKAAVDYTAFLLGGTVMDVGPVAGTVASKISALPLVPVITTPVVVDTGSSATVEAAPALLTVEAAPALLTVEVPSVVETTHTDAMMEEPQASKADSQPEPTIIQATKEFSPEIPSPKRSSPVSVNMI